jgi:hypothetical protein
MPIEHVVGTSAISKLFSSNQQKHLHPTMTTASRPWPFAVVGVILSMYAVYVEHKVAHKAPDEEFQSLCDIEEIGASCRYDP